MLDQAELDFGIYRIMNQKRKDIDKYLNEDLVKQVHTVISENASGKSKEIEKQIEEATAQAHALGIDPNALPKIKELKDQLAIFGSAEDMENDVYSHLATFFSRYYEGGDFISQRRYKKDVYAIPYEGEEVKLHWANADQYYIKTSEYFRTYSFKTNSGKKVEFTLKDATVEQNNNKAQGNQERRFAIYDEKPYEEIDGVMHVNFTYELMPKTVKQGDLIAKAYEMVKPLVSMDFIEVLATLCPTEKNSKRTLLEKHLNDYVARNTFDYFIHKDLHGFLSRELDFYIKNEILFIDDINAKNDNEFLQYLTVIKAVKAIGGKIIEFLSSLENFQKKLWLKKKFVVDSNYCITLDRIPEEFYEEIASNDAQREEWVKLFAIDLIKGNASANGGLFGASEDTVGYSNPLSVEFLKQNPYLLVDTKFYPADFKHRLLSEIPNLDEQTDGLMISSENFQALNLLQEKYQQSINTIYIDPPYNTNASEIVYKNGYKNSSWVSLMYDRLVPAKELQKLGGMICATIDDFQLHELYYTLNNTYGKDNFLGTACIKNNPQGRSSVTGFQISHEYGLFYGLEDTRVKSIERNENQIARYGERDEKGPYEWRNLRAQYSQESLKMAYPICIKRDGSDFRIPAMNWNEETGAYIIEEDIPSSEFISLPVDETGRMRTWKYAISTLLEMKDSDDLGIRKDRRGEWAVYYKGRMKSEGMQPFTMWDKPEYSASTFGANLLADIIGKGVFSYPKSIYAVRDSLKISSSTNCFYVLDFFAGSGTTGHAVISLNREDNGRRKYILVEMGDYFETVTKPRIQKVIYSEDWKDGKPVSRKGISHCMKYIRLEQYEDTLNNLIIKDESKLWAGDDQFNNSYMLGYMLDTETKDSLFNLKWFENPFEVSLKVTRNNEMQEHMIDMVDTFNYLIGLNVDSISYPKKGICAVEGVTHRGEKTLVIWRDCTKVDNAALVSFFSKSAYSTKGDEFDRIYINGDNNLENLRTSEEHWKVVLIEEEFSKRMFEE